MIKDFTVEQISGMKEIGSLRKNLSGIIDAAIIISVFLTVVSHLPTVVLSYLEKPFRPELFILLTLAVYRLLSLVFFNRTAGMRICGMSVLNNELGELSLTQKIFAAFFILINGVNYYTRRGLDV